MRGERWRPIALVLIAYAFVLVAIHPFGNVFYGADDWAYGWSVRVMVEQGQLRASAWVTAAAVPQTLLGAAATFVFGLQPRVLNALTLVISIAGVAGIFFAGRILGFDQRRAGLAALVATLNPLYLGFAGSFMSDMYYAVLMIASVAACLHALRNGSLQSSAIGGALASLAFLNRQVGLSIPVAFGTAVVASWYLRRIDGKRALASISLGAFVPAVTIAAYRLFPDAFGGVTAAQRLKMTSSQIWARFLEFGKTADHAYLAVLYVALFVSPLVLSLLRDSRFPELLSRPRWRIGFWTLFTLSLVVYALRLGEGETFMVRGEFLNASGFGPPPLAAAASFWRVLAFVASMVLPVILIMLAERLSRLMTRSAAATGGRDSTSGVPEVVFLAAAFAGHLGLLASFIAYYNNYFLPLVPLGAILLTLLMEPANDQADRGGWHVAVVLVALSAAVSVVLLDRHARYVEADRRTTKALVAAGMESRDVFGYASDYAWRHDDIVTAEIEKGAWGPLERIRASSTIQILNESDRPRGKGWERVKRVPYSTLMGEGSLQVWRRE